MNIFRLLTFVFIAQKLFAQPKEIKDFENNFCKEYWKAGDINLDFEKRELLMEKFSEKTKNFIKKRPQTLNFPFKKIDCISINTSKNGILRVYSWDIQMGGTAHAFNTLFQYKSNGKVYTDSPQEDNMDRLYHTVHQLNFGSKTYYLLESTAVGSTRDYSVAIEVFEIIQNKFKRTNNIFAFKTESVGEISFYYDASTIKENRRTDDLLHYEPKEQKIHVAIVDENGKVSNKNIVYKVKGNKFVFSGFEKAK